MSDYPNSGSLRGNKFKQAGTKQPDQKGEAHVTCPACKVETHYVLSAWNRGQFLNFKFQTKAEADSFKRNRQGGSELPAENQSAQAEQPNGENETQIPF